MDYNPYLVSGQEYFISALNKRLNALREAGKDIINLIIGDPLDPTYEPVRQAVIDSLQSRDYSQYPKTHGEPAYRHAVAQWAKNYYNIDLEENKHIISCNGTKEAIFHIPLLYSWLNKKEIWIPSLSYPVYAASANILKIPYRFLPLSKSSDFLPDLDSFSHEDWQKCQIFWLNSPHNPTTAIASRSYFEKLLSLAKQYNFLVCSDECYNELFYEDSRPTSALDFPESRNWLVFRSLSKRSHMTGYRSGALISKNERIIELLIKLRAPLGVGTPTFIQQGAIKAWQDIEHPAKLAQKYRVKRALFLDALKAKGFQVFSARAGFYMWFSHPAFKDSYSMCEAFIDAGLLITPGTAFGSDGEGYARLTYCDRLEVCKEAARRIHDVKLPC